MCFGNMLGLFEDNDVEPQRLREAGQESAKPETQVYDPFAGERAQYQAQLSTLSADPSGIVNTPGYAAGLQAVTRKLASQGYLGSGNMMTALQTFGGQFFNQEMQRLMSLSGASLAPTKTDSSGIIRGEEGAAKDQRSTKDDFLNMMGIGLGAMKGGIA